MKRSEKFCDRLNELLWRKGMTVRDLCCLTGLQYTTINNYLTGVREPRLDTLCLIADKTHVDLRWLVGYDL